MSDFWHGTDEPGRRRAIDDHHVNNLSVKHS
jgi:hypothetical protein